MQFLGYLFNNCGTIGKQYIIDFKLNFRCVEYTLDILREVFQESEGDMVSEFTILLHLLTMWSSNRCPIDPHPVICFQH